MSRWSVVRPASKLMGHVISLHGRWYDALWSSPALAEQYQLNQQRVEPPAAPGIRASAQQQTQRSRGMAGPPKHASRFGVWLILLGCLAVSAPAMLIELHRPDATSTTEVSALTTTIHTHVYQEALPEPDDLSVSAPTPHLNNESQLQTPPGITWLQLAAINLSRMGDLTLDETVWRCRLASVVMALLTIAAVYWAGLSIGGLTTAAYAALVCAGNLVFIHHARVADATTSQTTLITVSIAAALWAIRPLRPSASFARQTIGWGVCGLAMGAAMLTAGALAVPAVVLPLLLIVLLSGHRISRLLGLLAAIAISALVIVPWFTYVHEKDPQVYRLWLAQINPLGRSADELALDAGQRASVVILVLLPWTIWLIGAIAQPFSASSKGWRVRLFLAWLWFAAVAMIILLIPLPGNNPKLSDSLFLLVVPAAAVLIGQLFSQYSELAAEGRYPRLWRVLRWLHIVLLVGASVAVPALLHWQQVLREWGLISQPIASEPGVWFWIILSLILTAIAMLSVRFAMKHHPGQALLCWVFWAFVMAQVIAIPLARSELRQSPWKPVAEYFDHMPADAPVFWLQPAIDSGEPTTALLLYAQRPLPAITPAQLAVAAAQGPPLFVIAQGHAILTEYGFVADQPLDGLNLRIWRLAPADKLEGPDESETPDA